MFQPNQLEFFYGEEETNQKVWNLDRHLNRIYFLLKVCFALGSAIVVYRTAKQQYEMRKYADAISIRLQKEGGSVIINPDQSL